MSAVVPLEFQEVRVCLALPPSDLANIRSGVQSALCALLMRFHADIDGVLLSFKDLSLESTAARVVDEQPFLHFPVRFKGLVFRPMIGALMVGRIEKVGTDYIGLLVCGMFNASIMEKDMNHLYKFDDDSGEWMANDPSAKAHLAVNEHITFTVLGFHEARGLISIVGALAS